MNFKDNITILQNFDPYVKRVQVDAPMVPTLLLKHLTYFERLRDFKSETGVKRKTMHYQNRDFYLIGSTGGVRNLPHYFYYLLSIY